MNFVTFCEEKSKRLKDFYEWWLKSHNENPKDFPMDLSEGDWEEQFELWEEQRG